VNVEGHGTFSGSVVVVVVLVSSVDSEEAPLRRGMMEYGCRNSAIVQKNTNKMIMWAVGSLPSNASVILLDQKSQ
jgi:hypothetical protein